METLIFPTDFSESAEKALDFAMEIAKKADKELYLINAYDLPYAQNVMTTSLLDIMRENSEKGLQKVEEKVKAAGLKYRVRSLMGNPIRVVKELTKKDPDSVVVMGTKGASGLEEVLIGSNAAGILQNVDVPVLAVPIRAKFKDINRIVYCTDLRSTKNDRALRRLANLAKILKAEVMILHIQHDKTEDLMGDQRSKFDQHFEGIEHTFHVRNNDDVEQAIMQFADEKEADLVALLTRRYGLIRNLFHTSLASKVAFHSRIPLLVLHESR